MQEQNHRPKLNWWRAVIMATSVSIVPQALHAQKSGIDRNLLDSGRWSLAFGVNSAQTGQLGFWRHFRSHVSFGMNVTFNYSNDDNTFTTVTADSVGTGTTELTSWSLGLEPRLKFYLRSRATVSAYVTAGAGFTHSRGSRNSSNGENTHQNSNAATALIGIGTDWFPLDGISLGGFTGLRFSFSDVNSAVHTTQQSHEVSRTTVGSGTFFTALVAHLYF